MSNVEVYGVYEVWQEGRLLYEVRNKVNNYFYTYVTASLGANTPEETPNSADMAIDHLLLGTGSTPPTDSDIGLEAPTITVPVTGRSFGTKTATATFVLSPADGAITTTEVGVYGVGGGLISRALLPITKPETATLNIVYRLTLKEALR